MEIQIHGSTELDKEKIYDFFATEFNIPRNLITILNVDYQTSGTVKWSDIYEEVKSGITIQQIGFKYHLNNTTIRNNLVKLGWKPIRTIRNVLTIEQKEQLYKDWNNGMTANELAFKYKRTCVYIRSIIRHLNR